MLCWQCRLKGGSRFQETRQRRAVSRRVQGVRPRDVGGTTQRRWIVRPQALVMNCQHLFEQPHAMRIEGMLIGISRDRYAVNPFNGQIGQLVGTDAGLILTRDARMYQARV